MEAITSLQNPKLKRLVRLQQKSAERRKAGIFVVEGRRELKHCIDARLQIEAIYYCPEILFAHDRTSPAPSEALGIPKGDALLCKEGEEEGEKHHPDVDVHALLANAPTRYEVSRAVYDKIAYRGGTEGIMAEVHTPRLTLDDLPTDGLYVVLESVEKPGNLGAILRSADAARATAVIVCDPLTDLYNPNLIRSSIGAAFTVPTVACSSAECISWLKRAGIAILTAQLQDSRLYYDTDMRRPTAIVMGTEATGLTTQWREAADAHIRIPMLGHLDSLNVSVSAAILLFEAVRQRQLSHGEMGERIMRK